MEIINWILWSIGLVAVAVALFCGIAWTVIIVAEIVTDSRRQKTAIADNVAEAYRWLSGFKDLDMIWDYIYGKSQYHNIDALRTAYARERGTTVYGKALDAETSGEGTE